MPRSRTIPENLVVTLTIFVDAPAVKLSLIEATIVGLASAGHSVESIEQLLSCDRFQLEKSLTRLRKQFECEDETALWKILRRDYSGLFDSSTL